MRKSTTNNFIKHKNLTFPHLAREAPETVELINNRHPLPQEALILPFPPPKLHQKWLLNKTLKPEPHCTPKSSTQIQKLPPHFSQTLTNHLPPHSTPQSTLKISILTYSHKITKIPLTKPLIPHQPRWSRSKRSSSQSQGQSST